MDEIKLPLGNFLKHVKCHNPSLGLATKARGCKVAGQEGVQLHMLLRAQRV